VIIRWMPLLTLVNKATNPNFHAKLEFDRLGTQRPKETELIRPLEQWLTGLDPDEVAAAVDAGQEPLSFISRWVIGGSYSRHFQSNPSIGESLADY
jgi:hypothetical protein